MGAYIALSQFSKGEEKLSEVIKQMKTPKEERSQDTHAKHACMKCSSSVVAVYLVLSITRVKPHLYSLLYIGEVSVQVCVRETDSCHYC